MGKKIIPLGGKEIAEMLKKTRLEIPDDVEVLHATCRMEFPGFIRLLCSSRDWPVVPEAHEVPTFYPSRR